MLNKNAWFHTLVLATLLATGYEIAWGLLMVATLVQAVNPSAAGERLHFLPDGTPIIEAYSEGMASKWRDLAGNRIEHTTRPDEIYLTRLPNGFHQPTFTPGLSWSNRIRSFGQKPTYGYFVCDGEPAGFAYFVAYDSESKTRIGFLGTSNFYKVTLPPDEHIPFTGLLLDWADFRVLSPAGGGTAIPRNRLPGRPRPGFIPDWLVFVLARDHKLYEVDLSKLTMRVVRDDPHMRSAGLIFSSLDGYRLAVRTDDAVLLHDERGQEKRRYPIPRPLRDKDLVWAETSKGEAVLHATEDQRERSFTIYWIDASGNVRQESAKLSNPAESRLSAIAVGAVVPMPLVLNAAVAVVVPALSVQDKEAASIAEARERMIAQIWPGLILAHIVGVFLAVFCYRRQAIYAIKGPGRYLWPLFVFLLGWPGWIGYRLGRSWPVLEPCPSCGVPAPRHQETCARCNAEFARPALKGTEVFA